jgi:hypothetical protein
MQRKLHVHHPQTTVTQLTLVDLVENEATRQISIRFICGVRKALYTSGADLSQPSMIEMSQTIERLYHAIGADARKEAFESHQGGPKLPSQPVEIVEVEPFKPTKPLISHETCEAYVREYINTDDDDELEFTFGEICDFVCEAYLEKGKYEWDEHASEVLSGNARWYNQVQTCLQRLKVAGLLAHSKKRQCWIIL